MLVVTFQAEHMLGGVLFVEEIASVRHFAGNAGTKLASGVLCLLSIILGITLGLLCLVFVRIPSRVLIACRRISHGLFLIRIGIAFEKMDIRGFGDVHCFAVPYFVVLATLTTIGGYRDFGLRLFVLAVRTGHRNQVPLRTRLFVAG